MGFIIDAQVVNGLCCEEAGDGHSLSGSPATLFEQLSRRGDVIALDSGGAIEHEWRSCCEREWFDAWFSELASTANLAEFPTQTERQLLQVLRTRFGFPNSRDKVYIRAAVAVVAKRRTALIVTDDMDFFDPPIKATPRSPRIVKMLDGSVVGPLQGYLYRDQRITVGSVLVSLSLTATGP